MSSSSYSFLIVDTYYPQFLSSLYAQFPELASKRYEDQLNFIFSQCFGTADYYSKNLTKLGCKAEEVIPNNEILQLQWAQEHGMNIPRHPIWSTLRRIPKARRLMPNFYKSLTILMEQIRTASPDVLYVQDLSFLPLSFLREVKEHVRILVGQIACPLPKNKVFAHYDILLSSLPNYVSMFRSLGIKSEYFKIGFDNTIFDEVKKEAIKYDVVHVGGYGPLHNERNDLLERVAQEIRIDFWGYGADNLPSGSRIRQNYHGECWGIDRYRIFRQSRIVITKHIQRVAGDYCNNMTMYEATGCGALLVTDYKKNIHDLFSPGKEAVAYASPEEAVRKIKYYLEHDQERKEIAHTGQQKTLREHSYYCRMQELIAIIKEYI